jgi:predicted membrane protein
MLGIVTGLIYWDVFISLVGMAFFIYGKKRPDAVALVTGLVLMVYPYFFSTASTCIAVGLIIVGFFVVLKKVFRI